MSSKNFDNLFNKFLKISIFVSIILIGIGTILNIINHNLYLDIPWSHLWLSLIKSGVMLLIGLQIFRVLYIALVFLHTKQLLLSAMSWFIGITLTASLAFAHLPIFVAN